MRSSTPTGRISVFNGLWLAAFGSPLAWRFGTTRFLLFSAIGAVAGALLHLLIYPDEHDADGRRLGGDLGAHGGSGRFVFAAGGPLRGFQADGRGGLPTPGAAARGRHPRQPRVIFLAVWFGLNLRLRAVRRRQRPGFGDRSPGRRISAASSPGLLLFPLFDPVDRSPRLERLTDALLQCILSSGAATAASLQSIGWDVGRRRAPATPKSGDLVHRVCRRTSKRRCR